MLDVKELAVNVSYALGLEGEFTEDVETFTNRIINNRINAPSKAQQAIESMRIAKAFRSRRDIIEWEQVALYLERLGG
jgi:hypothetical protein